MSTSNSEAPGQQHKVCWHYLRGECAHDDDFTCAHCAEVGLDEICFNYLSGECTYDDECAHLHLHPDWLDPALIPLLATLPSDSPFRKPPPVAGHDKLTSMRWDFRTGGVTYKYEEDDSITLPIPHSGVSYSAPEAPASTNADGQSDNTCAYNLEHCWAPHCAIPWTGEAAARRLCVEAKFPSSQPRGGPPPIHGGQGKCVASTWSWVTEQWTHHYEGGGTFTLGWNSRPEGGGEFILPITDAACSNGQSSAPETFQPATKKRCLEVDNVSRSAGETPSASADVDMEMVDRFASATLDSKLIES